MTEALADALLDELKALRRRVPINGVIIEQNAPQLITTLESDKGDDLTDRLQLAISDLPQDKYSQAARIALGLDGAQGNVDQRLSDFGELHDGRSSRTIRRWVDIGLELMARRLELRSKQIDAEAKIYVREYFSMTVNFVVSFLSSVPMEEFHVITITGEGEETAWSFALEEGYRDVSFDLDLDDDLRDFVVVMSWTGGPVDWYSTITQMRSIGQVRTRTCGDGIEMTFVRTESMGRHGRVTEGLDPGRSI